MKKKQAKKGNFWHFFQNFDQKTPILWSALPPQNEYILARKALLESFLGHSAEKGYLKIVKKGAGGRISEKESARPAPSPLKSAGRLI